MWEGIVFYLSSMAHDSILFRVAVVSAAIVLTLTPPDRSKKYWFRFLVRWLGVMFVQHVLRMLNTGFSVMFGYAFSIGIFIFEFLINAVVCAGYGFLCCKFERKLRFSTCVYLLAVIEIIVNLSYTAGHYVDLMVEGWTIPLLILIYALFVPFVVVELRFPLVKFLDFPKGAFVLYTTVGLLSVAVTLLTQILVTGGFAGTGSLYSIILFSLLYVFSIVSHLLIYLICLERDEFYKVKMENYRLRATEEQLQLTKVNLTQLRKLRHDIKNQFLYLNQLLELGQEEQVKEIIGSFSSVKLKPDYLIDCGNRDVGAILTMESAKALDYGIKIDCTVVIPSTLPFNNLDMCSLISNLIDNAMEANAKYGIKDDIKVQMNLRNELFYLCVKNRLPKDADRAEILRLQTGKSSSGHGFGLKIVNDIAHKYGGDVVYDVGLNGGG